MIPEMIMLGTFIFTTMGIIIGVMKELKKGSQRVILLFFRGGFYENYTNMETEYANDCGGRKHNRVFYIF